MIRFESAPIAFALLLLACGGTPSPNSTPSADAEGSTGQTHTASGEVSEAVALADADGDGVEDSQDRCPCVPEDADEITPGDGCPEPDNDGDGVCDERDECRDNPGVAQSESGGCPRVCLDCNGQPGDVLVDAIFNDGAATSPSGEISRIGDQLLRAAMLTQDAVETAQFTPSASALIFCRVGPSTRRVREARIAALVGSQSADARAFLTRALRFGMSPLMSAEGMHCAPLPELQHLLDWRPLFGNVNEQALCHSVSNQLASCEARDLDADGVPNDVDQCIDLAEDQDGFQDADGCPEHDNDDDGLCDGDDACPDTPSQFTFVEDADGCPHTSGTAPWPSYVEIPFRGRTTNLNRQHPSHAALAASDSARIAYEGPIVITVGAEHGAPLWVWESRANEIKTRLLARGAHVSQFLITRDSESSNVSRIYADQAPKPTCNRRSWPATSTEPRMGLSETSGGDAPEAAESEVGSSPDGEAPPPRDESEQPLLAPEADSP